MELWKRGALFAGAAAAGLAAGQWATHRQRSRFARWLVEQEHEPERRIVVLGAGFGGLYAAIRLADAFWAEPKTEVMLIDRHNYHLFTPMLTLVAGSAVEPRSVAYPVRRLLRDHHLSFRRAEVQSIDLANRRVETSEGSVSFDKLIIGLGAVSNFFGLDDVAKYGYTFKTVSDAMEIRDHIVDCFERAANTDDPEKRQSLLTFVIVGGGPTGVELAASLHDFIHHTLIEEYPNISFEREVRIKLCEARERLLPNLEIDLANVASHVLRRKEVELLANTAIARVWEDGIATKDGREIPTSTLIWVAGVQASPVAATLDVPKGRAGAIVVDDALRVPGTDGVYALGDNAAYTDPTTNSPLPPDAKVAIQQAVAVADNVIRELRGEEPQPFVYRRFGDMISLGTNAAVADVLGVKLSGATAWLLWRTFYLGRLHGLENKSRVVLDWALGALFERYTAELDLS